MTGIEVIVSILFDIFVHVKQQGFSLCLSDVMPGPASTPSQGKTFFSGYISEDICHRDKCSRTPCYLALDVWHKINSMSMKVFAIQCPRNSAGKQFSLFGLRPEAINHGKVNSSSCDCLSDNRGQPRINPVKVSYAGFTQSESHVISPHWNAGHSPAV